MFPRPRPISVEERQLRTQALFDTFRSQLLRLHFPPQDLVQALEETNLDIWSHGDNIIVRSLRNLLPFGRHLVRSDVDTFVDHTLQHISRAALEQLFYWQLAGTTNSLNEPLEHLILTEEENQFWCQYVPQNSRIILDLLYSEHHVYYLTRFYLTHDRIEIGFSEIRISTRLAPGQPPQNFPLNEYPPRLVITEGREYSYRWNTQIWTNSLRNPDQSIINPLVYYFPPLAPQSIAFAYRNTTPPVSAVLEPPHTLLDPEALVDALRDFPETLPGREETLPPSSPRETSTSVWSEPQEDWNPHPLRCRCAKEVCDCGYRPDTPPTPPDIHLWRPHSQTLPSVFAVSTFARPSYRAPYIHRH